MDADASTSAIRVMPSPLLADAALAVVLTVVQIVMVVVVDTPDDPVPFLGVCLLVASTLVLVVRRRLPVGTWIVAVGTTAAYGLARWPDPPLYLGGLAAICSAAALTAAPTAWWIGGVSLAFACTAWLVDPSDTDLNDALTPALGVTTAWLAGRVWASQRAAATLVAERAERAERDRAAERARAVETERLRIARELHDITAHHVSMIAVQAEAALVDEQRRDVALGAIAAGARSALADLRRMLGLLRDDASPTRRTHPGVGDLTEVVDATNAAGLATSLEVHGPVDELDGELALNVHRVVQELATNVVRHAGASQLHMVVRAEPGEVTVQVDDDGRGWTPQPESGGHGLRGVRERAALFDGEVTLASSPSGGARVTVRFPR